MAVLDNLSVYWTDRYMMLNIGNIEYMECRISFRTSILIVEAGNANTWDVGLFTMYGTAIDRYNWW